jgi:hypothetical protein
MLTGCSLCAALQAGGGLAGKGDSMMAGVGVTGSSTTTMASPTSVPLGQPLLPVKAALRAILCFPGAKLLGAVQDTSTGTPDNGCGPERTSAISRQIVMVQCK